jgi:hypothetical protein
MTSRGSTFDDEPGTEDAVDATGGARETRRFFAGVYEAAGADEAPWWH